MNLVLDVGGTRLKWAWTEGSKILESGAIPWHDWPSSWPKVIQNAHRKGWTNGAEARRWMRPWPPAASAVMTEQRWQDNLGLPLVTQSPEDQLPFSVAYQEGWPGCDRLAAAVACAHRDPGGSFVVIDAGTCITVDLLSPGSWRGGAIMPGLRMQAEAMEKVGLPLLQPNPKGHWAITPGAQGALGQSTLGAIQAGVAWATRSAVEALTKALKDIDPCAQVVLTGGDADHFAGLGGWQTFADPDLVLTGLAIQLNLTHP